MNIVDKICELIINDNTINTFNNNIDLFQDFYYNNMSIKYNGIKVFKIYEYLLSLNIDEYHETMPYINSKIFHDFNDFEMFVTQSVYIKNTIINDEYAELLYTLIKEYNVFKAYKDQSELYKLLSDNTFVRDYTGAMMIALNSSFFNISNENINNMMSIISNNSYLQGIIEDGKIGNKLLDRDYIFQYVSRYLFNLEFVNQENIKNDILITAIRDSKIRDKGTLERIFKSIDINFLFQALGDNVSKLIDIIDISFEDEYDRISLFKIVYNKLLEKNEYKLLMDLIIKDNRYSRYIEENEKEIIINGFCNNYSKNVSEDEIKYVLNYGANELFLINLKSNYKDNNWSGETRKIVYEATKNIPEYELDFDSSIRVLESLFTKKGNVDYYKILASLKRLIKNYLQTENITIYVSDNDNYGCSFTDDNCIQLSNSLIKKILTECDYESNPESIHILETAFHEARHIEQFKNIKNGNIDSDAYVQYKEDLLSNISSSYYNENYVGVSFEKDARITGSLNVVKLLNRYFPYMKNTINYYTQKVSDEVNKKEKNKKIFELSETISTDDAISKLLSINPSLIQKYDFLAREYNFDGTKIESIQSDKKL